MKATEIKNVIDYKTLETIDVESSEVRVKFTPAWQFDLKDRRGKVVRIESISDARIVETRRAGGRNGRKFIRLVLEYRGFNMNFSINEFQMTNPMYETPNSPTDPIAVVYIAS